MINGEFNYRVTLPYRKVTINLAKEIFIGIAKYILPFKKIADKKNFNEIFKDIYLDGKFGVVRNHGNVDLNDPLSSHHKRNTLGITSPQVGWINNPSMKLCYFQENAKVVLNLVKSHLKTIAFLKQISNNKNLDIINRYRNDIAKELLLALKGPMTDEAWVNFLLLRIQKKIFSHVSKSSMGAQENEDFLDLLCQGLSPFLSRKIQMVFQQDVWATVSFTVSFFRANQANLLAAKVAPTLSKEVMRFLR